MERPNSQTGRGERLIPVLLTLLHGRRPHLYKFRRRLLLLSLKEEILDSELPLDPSLE